MKLYHVSNAIFTSFDQSKNSPCGDFGAGHYCYNSELVSYGITKGNFLLEFDFVAAEIIEFKDYYPTSDELKEKALFDYNAQIDAILVGDVVVIKKQGLEKLKFLGSSEIIETSSMDWNKQPLLFAVSDGRIFSTGVYQ